jgi:hypothetical protein
MKSRIVANIQRLRFITQIEAECVGVSQTVVRNNLAGRVAVALHFLSLLLCLLVHQRKLVVLGWWMEASF